MRCVDLLLPVHRSLAFRLERRLAPQARRPVAVLVLELRRRQASQRAGERLFEFNLFVFCSLFSSFSFGGTSTAKTGNGFSFGATSTAKPTSGAGFSFGATSTAKPTSGGGFSFGATSTAKPTTSALNVDVFVL